MRSKEKMFYSKGVSHWPKLPRAALLQSPDRSELHVRTETTGARNHDVDFASLLACVNK